MQERKYRISTKRTLGIALPLLLLALLAFPLRAERGVLAFIGGIVLLAVFWAFWATGLEYQLTATQISRASRFGTRTLLWEQLSELRYRGEKRSYSLIPLGSYATMLLRDVLGRTLTISGGGNIFGYLVACPTGVGQLQEAVLDLSHEPLFRHLSSRFDAGENLQLGPVGLSRANGLTIKSFRGRRHIPLDDLASFGVHEGMVYLYRRNAKESEPGFAVAAVPNCFAVLSLLESLGVQPVDIQAGFLRPKAVP